MGVLTDFFRATETELRAYYATWRVPLATPRRTTVLNPFTRKPQQVDTWDPDPETPVEDERPIGPPPPSIDMKGLSHTNITSLIGVVLGDSNLDEATFMRDALIGPPDGPWINELPPRFLNALGALHSEGLERVATRWAQAEREDIATIEDDFTRSRMLRERHDDYWREVLVILADFARASIAEGKRMYMWTSL